MKLGAFFYKLHNVKHPRTCLDSFFCPPRPFVASRSGTTDTLCRQEHEAHPRNDTRAERLEREPTRRCFTPTEGMLGQKWMSGKPYISVRLRIFRPTQCQGSWPSGACDVGAVRARTACGCSRQVLGPSTRLLRSRCRPGRRLLRGGPCRRLPMTVTVRRPGNWDPPHAPAGGPSVPIPDGHLRSYGRSGV